MFLSNGKIMKSFKPTNISVTILDKLQTAAIFSIQMKASLC